MSRSAAAFVVLVLALALALAASRRALASGPVGPEAAALRALEAHERAWVGRRVCAVALAGTPGDPALETVRARLRAASYVVGERGERLSLEHDASARVVALACRDGLAVRVRYAGPLEAWVGPVTRGWLFLLTVRFLLLPAADALDRRFGPGARGRLVLFVATVLAAVAAGAV